MCVRNTRWQMKYFQALAAVLVAAGEALAQETQQMHAVSFNKGCYLGQEIVERIRSRGHVNRLLVKLEVEGDAPLAGGTKISAGAGEAGEIASSAFSPALEKVVALAYVRAQYAAAGTVLQAGGRTASVSPAASPVS